MVCDVELRDTYEVNAVKHRVYSVELPAGEVTVTVAHSLLLPLDGPGQPTAGPRRLWTCTIARRESLTLTDRDQRSIRRRLVPHVAMSNHSPGLNNAPDGYTVTVWIEDPLGTI
jgi:hypothetical protein